MSMNDVIHAYHAVHTHDKSGHFPLSAEFDEVRDRLAFLRDHPELGALEPDVLEVAAQMSQVSRDLAQTYSDEKVIRARAFLRERQAECARFEERLQQPRIITQEIADWRRAVEMDEAVARAQVDRLVGNLREVIPEVWDKSSQPAAVQSLPPRTEPPKPAEPPHGAMPLLHSRMKHGPAR